MFEALKTRVGCSATDDQHEGAIAISILAISQAFARTRNLICLEPAQQAPPHRLNLPKASAASVVTFV
jgi:hypothetical protein